MALISAYEHERIPFNKKKIQKIAKYFNVSVNYLTGKNDSRTPTLLDELDLNREGYVSNNIYAERKSKHMTQKELGKEIGVNREYISEYELGIRPIPVENWGKLSKALSSEASYLLGVNGKYLPHSMDDFILSLKDHELLYSTKELLRKLDWAYKTPAFALLYILLIFCDENSQKVRVHDLKNIKKNSVYMLYSIICDAVIMLLDGEGKECELDNTYFMKLFSIIEDYDLKKYDF
ncbi:helix-turn-helix domain-containing protein [Limosilactobacillus albertensis]|uniref:helix-turn-helix transcriptional regulator n=1 Tax=Limosilactobacillus albertensis TaxID=2759752 RepID=UPI001E4B9F5E|nr:helix-turn-helix transcriptional regulator [Limosilactobacillus albertensis]MCD7117700.1 helix-turn-helix domain-containing protein [Limosilactobacillus albertensis]MCD7128496.1 helix-turn-helix domain-containing protein [Limosilactobacillus albertensis]